MAKTPAKSISNIAFMFSLEIDITERMSNGMSNDEEVLAAYKGPNDYLGLLTNKRIIYRGLLYGESKAFVLGDEIYTYNIPFSSVDFYSTEYSDSTLLDVFRHVNIWTKGGRLISLLFGKHVDMGKVRKILANSIL